MKTDIQIAQEAKMLPIKEVAAKYGITEDDLEALSEHQDFCCENTGDGSGSLIPDFAFLLLLRTRGNVKNHIYAKEIPIFSWRESGFFHIFAPANKNNMKK